MKEAKTISISLVSHTNAGKTTLARTLLGRDIGEVRDAPHVTDFAEVHTLVETAQGDRLELWDTPGFGDSVRLAKRLRERGKALGWFLTEVWDRWRDRPFWASQQALRNVRDEADVMLYLVNASESPQAAGYIAPEMEILGWLDKPVVVLLNQLGAPREAAVEQAEIERWRVHLQAFGPVRAVLPLDAFARCWVQELTLLRAVEAVLPEGTSRDSMVRLRSAWQAGRERTFGAAIGLLAESLSRVAATREEVVDAPSLTARLRDVGVVVAKRVGLAKSAETPLAQAQKALAESLDREVRDNTLAMIRLHGLSGAAQGEILARLATDYELRLRMDETRAAVWGGMVTGALVGLKADLLSGGLTLGGGLLAGGLIGALGAAGLARCVNLVRGTERSWVAWNAEALDQLVEAALLRYLAVAHFGRGRGDWAQGESPPHWIDVIDQALAPERGALAAIWSNRGGGDSDEPAASLAPALRPLLDRAARTALHRLYPQSPPA